MGVEDDIHDLAHDPAAAFFHPNVVHVRENLPVGVGGGDGEPAAAKRGYVHDVVADETDLLEAQPAAARDLLDAGPLRADPLMDLNEIQLLGP